SRSAYAKEESPTAGVAQLSVAESERYRYCFPRRKVPAMAVGAPMTSAHSPQPAPGPTGRRPAYDPRDALADVAASRGSVADRLVTPWWYHPILGALIAAIVLVNALHLSNLVKIVVAVASAAGMGLLVSA